MLKHSQLGRRRAAGRTTPVLKGIHPSSSASNALTGHDAIGDLIVVFASKATNLAITIPAHFPNVLAQYNDASTSVSVSCAWMIAPTAAEVSGTWTNADRMLAFVYGSASGIGAYDCDNRGFTATPIWPALTLDEPGLSIVAGGIRYGTTRTGSLLAELDNLVVNGFNSGGVGHMYAGDTTDPVSAFAGGNGTMSPASAAGWCTGVFEVLAGIV